MSVTRVGRGLSLVGTLESAGEVVVDGRVEGEVHAKGRIEVGRRASLRGAVRARSVVVAGEVEGPITASERIELEREAFVNGDLRAARVLIADGARFDGKVHMERAKVEDAT